MRIAHVAQGLLTNKSLNLMIVLLVAIAIGCFGTTFSIFHMMSNNPLSTENELTRYLRLDDWDPERDLDWVPPLLVYRDAIHLANAAPTKAKKVLTYDSGSILIDEKQKRPRYVSVRVTSPDFFDFFKTDFQFGNQWTSEQEQKKERVIVLSSQMNKTLFDGKNSVGQSVKIFDEIFKVQGVLAPFNMTPKLYDLHVYPLGKIEDTLIPFKTGIQIEASPHGRFFGWRDETTENISDMFESTNIWMQLWLQFDSKQEQQEFQQIVTSYIQEQKKLGRMLRNTEYDNLITPKTWLEINKVVKSEYRFLVLLAIAFLTICMLSSMGLLHANFDSRKTSVALKRALGASRAQLMKTMMSEVIILAIIGCLLGSMLIYFGLGGIRFLYGSGMEQLAKISVTSISVTIALAIFSAFIIALFPAWKTCHQAPAPLLK